MWTLADFNATRWVEKNLKAVFVAKNGDDRNDGHPARPVASLARAAFLQKNAYYQQQFFNNGFNYGPIVIASGVYSETVNLAGCAVLGDGFVILDGSGAVTFHGGANGNFFLRALTIQNYGFLFNTGDTSMWAEKCRLINIDRFGGEGFTFIDIQLRENLHIKAPKYIGTTVVGAMSVDGCTFIDSSAGPDYDQFGRQYSIRNSYLDPTSRINAGNGLFAVYNCNIQGWVKAQRLADYQLSSGNQAIDCVSTEPGFNNPGASDYTLATTSPMRNLATDGGYVGAYGIGINFSGLPDADVVVNSQWNSTLGAFVLTNPNEKGSIEYIVKDFQRAWILKEALLVGEEDNIDRQTIDATQSYEMDSFGQPQNVQSGALEAGQVYWVTGYDTVTYGGLQYTDGQFIAATPAGGITYAAVGVGKVVRLLEVPNIRLYEMKFSSLSAVDCVSRPWSYFVFNKVPTVDAAGRSNGHPLFNPATANPITVRYLKLRLTIMPNSLA